MRLREVLRVTGLSAGALYRAMAVGDFPTPVRLGRLVVWRRGEVDAWVDSRQQ
ncbi:AlpA family phage regulatory protein [Xanthomonas sacchari]|uniref:helix-turn-helix transcriptional regulator n=1 Tax=Xanthomonas sacchari TaxID=56458 RepID=UPI002980A871|nr:AlpA family phage regulatory protein [Xanthomonas sacchari]